MTKGQKREERGTWWWTEEVQAAINKKKEAFRMDKMPLSNQNTR
jgi:hypothetical protein